MRLPNVLIALTAVLSFQTTTVLAAPAPATHELVARQIPQAAIKIAKAWFKVGKSALENYVKVVDQQNQNGAGFFRDFDDLLNALPDPPAGIDLNAAPTGVIGT